MNVNYLRISVTDRCNLRCFYCMPKEGIDLKKHADIMSYEDIYKVTKVASTIGIEKVRLTGGEPLARLGVSDLITQLNSIDNISEISMTTNGVNFYKKADQLKKSGLKRVNISLDTLSRSQYREITGRDKLNNVLKSIDKAKELKLDPVKVNTVLIKGVNDNQIDDFLSFMDKKDIIQRFIEYMPVGSEKNDNNYMSINDLKEIINKNYELRPVNVKGNGPARYYKIKGLKGRIGFISPFSHDICSDCNRLRLTADGKIRSCLLKEAETSLYNQNELLDEKKIKEIVLKAIENKSPHGGYEDVMIKNNTNMNSIGG